jgi:hypothetical protein
VARALATLLETLERTGMREKGVEELTLVRWVREYALRTETCRFELKDCVQVV